MGSSSLKKDPWLNKLGDELVNNELYYRENARDALRRDTEHWGNVKKNWKVKTTVKARFLLLVSS